MTPEDADEDLLRSALLVFENYASGSSGCRPASGPGGSSTVMACWVPGPARCRACSPAIAEAAQTEEAVRFQPQEHVTR